MIRYRLTNEAMASLVSLGVYSISDLEQKIEAVTKLEAQVLTPSNGANFDGTEDSKKRKRRKRRTNAKPGGF
jgi:hypothetical protein